MTNLKDRASTIEKFSNFIKKVSINHSIKPNHDFRKSIFVNIFNKHKESNEKGNHKSKKVKV